MDICIYIHFKISGGCNCRRSESCRSWRVITWRANSLVAPWDFFVAVVVFIYCINLLKNQPKKALFSLFLYSLLRQTHQQIFNIGSRGALNKKRLYVAICILTILCDKDSPRRANDSFTKIAPAVPEFLC